MDFDFTPEEQKFADEVERWLVENHDQTGAVSLVVA